MNNPASRLQLNTAIQFVKGIGPRRAALLKKVDVETVEDLLHYFPRRHLDRSHLTKISDLKKDEQVTLIGRIYSAEMVQGRRKRFVLLVGDGSGYLQCVWFQGLSYINKIFKVGDTVAFSGKIAWYHGPQLVHPEYDRITEEGEADPLHTGGIVPLYPSNEALSRGGLDGRGFRKIIKACFTGLPEQIPETLPISILNHQHLMDRKKALENIHYPENQSAWREAQKRLKFEELFYIQLFLAIQRSHQKIEKKGIEFTQIGQQTRNLVKQLPFDLTSAQRRVLREIVDDMKEPRPMNRLLQGDVGSGKTVVALISMLIAIENGYQAAMMAPTEILAEQHYITLSEILESLDVHVALLKGSQKAAERKEILAAMASGKADLIVGTHALVQEGVDFHQLGLVVIDEQHRFGVMQRAVLRDKGLHPDVLVMTATPIPRTLALTLYGDLDTSIIDELPAGRKPIQTVKRYEAKRSAIYEYIRDEVKKGRQVYIVYPLVEESEKLDLAAATEGYRELSAEVFPELSVGLLHGRMKPDEKDQVMRKFVAGGVDILVSTTVIEVGVNVPNASVMLIEHAERFGLTQLHQLRGRIGRGEYASTCILLAQYPMSDDAKKRLDTMCRTNDGFEIAEVDLEIRGPGELFGTRQSGALNLKIANLVTDGPIVEQARKEAQALIEEDPRLEKDEHRGLRDTYNQQYRDRFHLIEVG